MTRKRFEPTLVLMLKEPRPGRVKTRLGRDIGMTGAAWWFRHQTERLIRRLDDPRWRLVLAVAPDREGMQSRVWPAHLARIPQGRGNLGHRMGRVLRSMGPGPVLIVGGDIPGVTPGHIRRAFGLLGRADMVLGPAGDGGYWSVGCRHGGQVASGLFDGVRWSTEHTLSDTIASVPGRDVALADTLDDVDTLADLKRLQQGGR